MTAPAIAASGANTTGNTNTDISVAVPAGIVAGNLLAIFGSANGGGSTESFTAPGAPWNQDIACSRIAGAQRLLNAIYTTVAVGGETATALTATPDSATQGMTGKMVRITHAGGTPLVHKVIAVTSLPGDSATTIDIPGVTTTVADCLVCYFVAGYGASVRTFTSDGDPAEQWDFGSDPGTANSQAMYSKTQASPGATGTETITANTNSGLVGVCIAFAPPLTGQHTRLPVLGVG